jgi:hypothetical protein
LNGLKIISPEFKSGIRSHARNSYESLSSCIFQVREKKREREGRAEIGKKEKARRNERKGRERPEHSVTDAFTHRPAPFTYWYVWYGGSGVVWEGDVHGIWMVRGPAWGVGLKEENNMGRGNLTERKVSGRGTWVFVECGLAAVLFLWQNYKILFYTARKPYCPNQQQPTPV